jgi:hypothetical protein
MLVSKQLCSVNVDKGVNMQTKSPQTKTHTHTHKIQQKRPQKKPTNKNNNKKTTRYTFFIHPHITSFFDLCIQIGLYFLLLLLLFLYYVVFVFACLLHGVHVYTVSRKSLNRAGGYISRNNIFVFVVKSLRNVIELTVQIYCKQQTPNWLFF